jgi:O-antigen/teichoic acid export membrane protein
MIIVQRFLGAVVGILFLLAALVFASVALGVALAIGVVVWAWLWWRDRSLPRGRVVIEGEYRDVTDLERLEGRGSERL